MNLEAFLIAGVGREPRFLSRAEPDQALVYVCERTMVRKAVLVEPGRLVALVAYLGGRTRALVSRAVLFEDAAQARACREVALRLQRRREMIRRPLPWCDAVRVARAVVARRMARMRGRARS